MSSRFDQMKDQLIGNQRSIEKRLAVAEERTRHAAGEVTKYEKKIGMKLGTALFDEEKRMKIPKRNYVPSSPPTADREMLKSKTIKENRSGLMKS